ncbi:MAG: NAD-dependent epimerase/dehydratase family protein [Bacteroidia bacterium]|nr:NAD-dependent epimerase/dehydratase family protein [Bacteroidia bacterium]MCF8427057.1 NAD-dependent epimerase/dehydratase family protein [Bacteroidia bacterium]MCF8446459.1 NAD-dependent epimerase/dehydratase family protein [Bacteroidia bacterium]
MTSVLITGGAGFIGYHLQKQLQNTHLVNAIDLIESPTSAIALRKVGLNQLKHADIKLNFLDKLSESPEVVVHLAAETGIAGSLIHPTKYFETNVAGTFNVLEQCRLNGIKNIIYASSSSVYAPNLSQMVEDADTSLQLSYYGTTKKMSEIMIENYCKQFGLTAIGLRFFTVYGSFTRPDMAAYKFMQAIDAGNKINLYNNGEVFRDFTHVSDVVKSIELVIAKIISEPKGSHQIFNIGYGQPISIREYAECIAKQLKKPLHIESKPLPENELLSTHSNTQKLDKYIHYKPICNLEDGIAEMTNWFKTNTYE